MPRIDDKPIEPKKPFKKKAYRPWNLMDDDFPVAPKAEQPKEEPIVSSLETVKPVDSGTSIDTPINTVPEVSIEPPAVTPIHADKVVALEQPVNKNADIVTNQESISNQLDTVKKSYSNHTDITPTTLVNKPESVSNRISNHYSNQIQHIKGASKSDTYPNFSVAQMVQRIAGLQKKILFHIVEDCLLNGTLSSSPISVEIIMRLINADKDTVKTAIQRLIRKNLISRGYGKPGRGGFSIFSITEDIRNAVVDLQRRNNSNNGLVTNWVSNQEPNSTYSSGSNINTTTKERSNENAEKFSSAWDKIDFEPLSSIGFTKSHLQQIIMADKLTSDIVQDSIYAFAFDMENNNKQKSLKTAPLNYFMGIMRSGMPYAPPQNYESPQEKAMRIFLERKRAAEERKQAMEQELFQTSYQAWEQGLSQQERDQILPEAIKNSRLASEKVAALRVYYKENRWPEEKYLYMQDINKLI